MQVDVLPLLEFELSKLLNKGQSAWGMTSDKCELVPSISNGMDGGDVMNMAVNCKRRGDYGQAFSLFLQLISDSQKTLGFVSLGVMRSLSKVLISANEFLLAWHVVSTISADIQQFRNADRRYAELFSQDFRMFLQVALSVVDRNDMSMLELWVSSVSGSSNYRFVKSREYIIRCFNEIRGIIKNIYGI